MQHFSDFTNPSSVSSSTLPFFLTHPPLPCSAEHNLPDSPFASPDPFAAPTQESEIRKATAASFAGINNGITSHLRPSALDIPSPKAYFFPMSRLSSDHGAGAIGM
ncbi:hypothetical protein U9M48_016233 [Paspalum notatum var. saurae]|uniref:Uncharacterized protein n=1 Tax=Paspalum notatum var. saurae TaxID=547442 RepID=A0AAQ3WML8_PASNO